MVVVVVEEPKAAESEAKEVQMAAMVVESQVEEVVVRWSKAVVGQREERTYDHIVILSFPVLVQVE